MQTSGRARRRTIPNMTPTLRIAHLYADEMNIYGDRGNILTLTKRAEWRGISGPAWARPRRPPPCPVRINTILCGGRQGHDPGRVVPAAPPDTTTASRPPERLRAA